jgi:hypothetical protein
MMGSTEFPASFSCWKNNEALVNHFQEAKHDSTRGKHGDVHMKNYRINNNYKWYIRLEFIVWEISDSSLDLDPYMEDKG